MNWKKPLTKLLKQKRGIIGLEAAIILIAFVIVAAVFSFMVVNQGLFATQRGQTVIQTGLNEASTPLIVDGQIFLRTSAAGTNITAILIPLECFGVSNVPMWKNETVVSLTVGSNAWANIYAGINMTEPTGLTYDKLLAGVSAVNATLFIQNNNGGQALSSSEKGYLIVNLGKTTYAAGIRTTINIEIRLEQTAPLAIDFTTPAYLPKDSWVGL